MHPKGGEVQVRHMCLCTGSQGLCMIDLHIERDASSVVRLAVAMGGVSAALVLAVWA